MNLGVSIIENLLKNLEITYFLLHLYNIKS